VNSTVNHQNDRSKNHPFLVITVVAFMTFMGVLTETSMNVTFPTLMKQFNISLSTVQWVTTGYLLMVALLDHYIGILETAIYQTNSYLYRQRLIIYHRRYYVWIGTELLGSIGWPTDSSWLCWPDGTADEQHYFGDCPRS